MAVEDGRRGDRVTFLNIGSARVEIPVQQIQNPQDLLAALQSGVPVGEWTHLVVAFAYKLWDRSLHSLDVR